MGRHAVLTIDEKLGSILKSMLAEEASGFPEAIMRWEIPKDSSFGDFSNSSSFKLASIRKEPPNKVSAEISRAFEAECRRSDIGSLIDRVEPKGGFMNVFLSQKALIEVVRLVLKEKDQFGSRDRSPSPSINIEFVSANPTGPLNVAHGRQAVVGDVLARLLTSQGYRVTSEYYLNDEGRQIEQLAKSILARSLEGLGRSATMPEDGYYGEYVKSIAKDWVNSSESNILDKPEGDILSQAMDFGKEALLKRIKEDLAYCRVSFNEWASQKWIRTSGRIDKAMAALKSHNAIHEAGGAVWFNSSQFGDDKDRVLRKSDGTFTYLTPDIAYHQWKYERGYDRILNLWGPDHHGYIARVKAAMRALNLPAGNLLIRIVQLVTLSRAGKPIPMSKRQGEFVTFKEVLDEVGVDATRFFFLMRTMESHLDFDLGLAKKRSQENPVYYIQYAHARICSILRKVPLRLKWRFGSDLSLLNEPEAKRLMRLLIQYPLVLHICTHSLEPHGITSYLRRLAETFHLFYTKHRVISENQALSSARLLLVKAARQVLANGLDILGISAPESM